MHESRFDQRAPEEQLAVGSRPVSGALVVDVAGEIDIVTTPRLQEVVEETIDRADGLVVIDLSGVTFLGSTGLAVLAEADATARRAGKSLRIVAGVDNRAVLRPIELTGLDRMLEIHGELRAAVADAPPA